MEKLKSYKDLLVWQKSLAMVKFIYELTRSFPQDERFGAGYANAACRRVGSFQHR